MTISMTEFSNFLWTVALQAKLPFLYKVHFKLLQHQMGAYWSQALKLRKYIYWSECVTYHPNAVCQRKLESNHSFSKVNFFTSGRNTPRCKCIVSPQIQRKRGKHRIRIDWYTMSSQTYRKIVLRKGNFYEFKIDLTFVREVCLSLHLVK